MTKEEIKALKAEKAKLGKKVSDASGMGLYPDPSDIKRLEEVEKILKKHRDSIQW